MKGAAALLACLLTGCNGSNVAVTGWPFDPIEFFTGHTHGEARLHLVTGATHRVSVDSLGTADGQGGLVLNQTIHEEGHPARTRRWVLHPAGANRWSGTLTDATGPVLIERTPTDLIIRYEMESGAKVEQHLQLPPGGIASNHMSVSRFGIRLATLDERIRKVPK